MKNILFISYHFYPSAAVAAKRIAKFCKYLPSFQFEPVILTVQDRYYERLDSQLGLNGVKTYRTRHFTANKADYNSNYFKLGLYYFRRLIEKCLFPDAYISWLPFALWTAGKIFRENNIDLIYASGPWFSSFITGWMLKKRFQVPLVIEYRDKWSLDFDYQKQRTARLHRFFDKKIMAAADKIVFASNGDLEIYKKHFREIDFTKAEVIRNSFDLDDFRHIKITKRDKFVVSYAGKFYGPRSPDSFFRALAQLQQEGKIAAQEFRFTGLGNLTEQMIPHDIKNLIEVKGYLSHRETLNCLANSDLLLLVVANEHHGGIPAKLYEYLALGRPVFVLSPFGSAVDQMVRELGCGVTADINDIDDIKSKLYHAYLRPPRLPWSHGENIMKFSCKNTTWQLAEVLSEVLGERRAFFDRKAVAEESIVAKVS